MTNNGEKFWKRVVVKPYSKPTFCLYTEWNLLRSAITMDNFVSLALLNYIIIYHDFLPTPSRGSHVKSGKTHTVIKIHPLAHILDS